jgi:hypothetical protein
VPIMLANLAYDWDGGPTISVWPGWWDVKARLRRKKWGRCGSTKVRAAFRPWGKGLSTPESRIAAERPPS